MTPGDVSGTSSPHRGGDSPDPGSGVGNSVGGVLGSLGSGGVPTTHGEPDEVVAAASRVLRDQATSWFEPLYARADGDPSGVPWAKLAAHPYVTGWLDQPGLDVAGVDAVVVGSGLGDDAAELVRRGCRVTALDISPTAVDWARNRFADLDITWEVADVLALPSHLVGAFGLVVEVRTAQSLPTSVRDAAMQGIATLVGPGGYLVATTLLATSDEAARRWEGPPWALAPAELTAWRAAGLERLTLDHPPVTPGQDAMEVRLTYQRPDADGQPRPPNPIAM